MLEEKYIDLLLNKCLSFKKSKSLFINYNELTYDFALKLKDYANKLGIDDVYLCCDNSYKKRDVLRTISKEDIKNNSLFDNSIWDEYAKKNASFLLIDS